jgi:hypothetical protein
MAEALSARSEVFEGTFRGQFQETSKRSVDNEADNWQEV